MSQTYQTLNRFQTDATAEGRVYHSGVLRVHLNGIDKLSMTVMGKYYPENEATPEGRINKVTAAFILENLTPVLTMAAEKLVEDRLILSPDALKIEALSVCDGVQVISGEILDFAMKFMTEENSPETGEPKIFDVLFHFPRNADGSVRYSLDGVKIAAFTE